MLFLASTFCGGNRTLDQSPVNASVVEQTDITNGVYDTLYGSSSAMTEWDGETVFQWDFDTRFYAKFNNNLKAGNIDWTLETVDSIKIKRRRKGATLFQTIKFIPVSSIEDFNIDWDDYTAGIGEYEYAVVPCLNGIEGSMNINSVESKFYGAFLIDSQTHYSILLDVALDYHRTKSGSSITTMGGKYPFYISNGNNNYDVGNLKGMVVQRLDCDVWDFEHGWQYRQGYNDFLTNGSSKLLKNEYGEIWIIDVLTHTISEDHSKHPLMADTSFDWQQCGDAENYMDLYSNGLIDYIE